MLFFIFEQLEKLKKSSISLLSHQVKNIIEETTAGVGDFLPFCKILDRSVVNCKSSKNQ
jgi:hypothetical protein